MKNVVLVNYNQEEQIKELETRHKAIKVSAGDFHAGIIEFVEKVRDNQSVISKAFLGRDIFLSAARQIVYSYKELKNIEGNLERKDENIDEIRDAMGLVFFMNTKAFLELVKKYTKYPIDTKFKDLSRDISLVRNCYAHFYEKEYLGGSRVFVRLDPNQPINDIETGLYKLEIFDLMGEKICELTFSLDLFYFFIEEIFIKIKNNYSEYIL